MFPKIASVLLVLAAAASAQEVDFRNFQYPAFAGLQSVPLKNGEYCSPPNRETCVELDSVVLGDLNGDGLQEAAVTLGAVFRSANGSHSEGFVFTLEGGKPHLIGRFAGGDRGSGGIISTTIRGKRLLVTRMQASCAACTDGTELDEFVVRNGRLVLVASSKTSAVPPQRRRPN